jgi:hypothetical protein
LIGWICFAVIFATGAIIEVWHKGSMLFDTARAYSQAWQDATPVETVQWPIAGTVELSVL